MTMKKLLCCLFALALISLCGCSLLPGVVLNNDIETLKGWSFQYNSGTNDYSLLPRSEYPKKTFPPESPQTEQFI